jgi:hypothetical protein
VDPSFAESSSVAKLITAASGMMAMKLRTKTSAGLLPMAPATIPNGTKISSQLITLLEIVAQITWSMLFGLHGGILESGASVEVDWDDGMLLSSRECSSGSIER